MIEIGSVAKDSITARELLSVLRSEWPDIDDFARAYQGLRLPDPIVAMSLGKVIGGLSYVDYPAPDVDRMALWINAVFVNPRFRGKGIATALIQRAIETEPCVYALTDVPTLYINLGFIPLQVTQRGTIVRFLRS